MTPRRPSFVRRGSGVVGWMPALRRACGGRDGLRVGTGLGSRAGVFVLQRAHDCFMDEKLYIYN